MQEKEILSIYTYILQLLKQRRLADAFGKLQPLLEELQDFCADMVFLNCSIA